MSEDPIRFASRSATFYGYAFNDPVDFNDPSGLDPSLLQKLLNWLCPTCMHTPDQPNSGAQCPAGDGQTPAIVPPWIPRRVFNKFNTKPFGGPYKPNSGPAPPDEPINPTEPSPDVMPPLDDPAYVPQFETPGDKSIYSAVKAVEAILNYFGKASSNFDLIITTSTGGCGFSLMRNPPPCT